MNAIQPLASKIPYMVSPGNVSQLVSYLYPDK